MKIRDFHLALQATGTLAGLQHPLSQYLAGFGIRMFSFTYYRHKSAKLQKEIFSCSSESYKLWHQHFLNQQYAAVDSTLNMARLQNDPLFWEVKQQLAEASSLAEQQMRLDSLKFGARRGLSIPVHGHDEDFASLTLIEMQAQNCLEKWQEQQYEWMSAAQCLFNHVQQLLHTTFNHSDNDYSLSDKELKCLQLLSCEQPMPLIARSMGIKVRTVNYHIQRLNKKLGVRNKYQALAKALALGLITK